jgi:hypothetical protein
VLFLCNEVSVICFKKEEEDEGWCDAIFRVDDLQRRLLALKGGSLLTVRSVV